MSHVECIRRCLPRETELSQVPRVALADVPVGALWRDFQAPVVLTGAMEDWPARQRWSWPSRGARDEARGHVCWLDL